MLGTLLTIALLLLTTAPAQAEAYRCTDRAGRVLFTDAPLPDSNCRPLNLAPLPSAGETAPPAPSDTGSQAPATPPAPAEPAAAPAAKTFAAWQAQVDGLVAQFQATRRQALYASLVGDKLKARRELKTIRARRDELRGEIGRAPLSRAERESLLGTLGAIVDSQ